MGILALSTPGSKVTLCVPRRDVSFDQLVENSKIPVKYYVPSSESSNDSVFSELHEISVLRQLQRPLDICYKVI
ncbi:hypothetical protein DPMN_143612 [Dreissena polymorpha]|uniref:Uncharacterized protein n=1 Tax=Dreissena polymorpha TaxID=45954 RepID=A0A9D4GE18_DREPO|nr:hypothetical protein DPMN_143612 [Dreissena polymorpha]